jgi:VWFA-related protein
VRVPAVVAIAVLMVVLAAAAGAQELPRLGETIEVSIVNVEVFVTDKQGRRVRGLTPDDFKVYENGVRQPVANFAEYASDPAVSQGTAGVELAAEARPAESPDAVPQKRTIVLFVEAFSLPPFHAKPFFAELRQTFRRLVRPGDAVVIAMWSNAMVIRQDFTDDLGAIEATLDAMEKESTGVAGNTAQLLSRQQGFEALFEGSLAQESFKSMNDRRRAGGDAFDQALFQLFKIKQKTVAIESLMQRIAPREGKKVLLLAVNRYGQHAGAELFGGTIPGEYRAALDTRQYRDRLTGSANASGITIYPLYPQGMAWTPFFSADRNPGVRLNRDRDVAAAAFDLNVLSNELHSLQEIARKTGGMMQWSSKEIVSLLPRIAEDFESYYSLAYRNSSGKSGRQRIEVKAKNRDYVVRARREYVQKTDEAKMDDRVVANLFQPVDGSVIPVAAEVGAVKKTGRRRWTAPLRVRVPISAITIVDTPKGPAGEFSVYVAPGGVFGLSNEVHRRKQPFTISREQLEEARDSYFTYDFELQLDEVTDRVSVAVYDEVSKEFGLAKVEVPERKVQ